MSQGSMRQALSSYLLESEIPSSQRCRPALFRQQVHSALLPTPRMREHRKNSMFCYSHWRASCAEFSGPLLRAERSLAQGSHTEAVCVQPSKRTHREDAVFDEQQ